MIIVEDPVLEFVPIEERRDGISLILRVKNGEDFLKTCILNIIDEVDEIIAVFNDSVDSTEDILVEIENQYPEKFKVFKYIPLVYPPNDAYYTKNKIRNDDPHCLSHYYNFALSKTTYSYVCKFDDDNLMFPGMFQKLRKDVENMGNKVTIGLRGINLFDLNGKLYVNRKNIFTSGFDTVMFKYNSSCRFIQLKEYELFKSDYGRAHHTVNSFYHLKYCKRDRGQNNYVVNGQTSDEMVKTFRDNILNADLILQEKFRPKLIPRPDPFKIGFEFLDNCQKTYASERFTNLENKLINKHK